MRLKQQASVLVLLSLLTHGEVVLAQTNSCTSELYKSMAVALKPGDRIDTVVQYLSDKNVEYVLADEQERFFKYTSDDAVPERFTLGVNHQLPLNRGLITRSELVLIRFLNQTLQTLACKVVATGP